MNARPNWLDPMRLTFAALVIFSHSFALTGAAEPLERLAHTTDLGKVAVAGFLILSGYLISSAWARTPSLVPYLRNRLLRIGPGFAVAFALSVLAAVAAGGSANWLRLPLDLLTLNPPSAKFPTAEFWQANGALWTIQLEFACYLLAPRVTPSRLVLGVAWVTAAVLAVLTPQVLPVPELASWWIRGALMFLSGACYWRFGLSAKRWALILCISAMPLLILNPLTWEIGIAVCGGYLLLSLGLKARPGFAWTDISYGLYLYGWPVQKLLIIVAGISRPWPLFASSLSIATLLGAASWYGIERYALLLKDRQRALHLQHGNKHTILTNGTSSRAVK